MRCRHATVSDLEAETARVEALGSRRLTADPMKDDGWTWHILADPDDNEFCILQPSNDGFDGANSSE